MRLKGYKICQEIEEVEWSTNQTGDPSQMEFHVGFTMSVGFATCHQCLKAGHICFFRQEHIRSGYATFVAVSMGGVLKHELPSRAPQSKKIEKLDVIPPPKRNEIEEHPLKVMQACFKTFFPT